MQERSYPSGDPIPWVVSSRGSSKVRHILRDRRDRNGEPVPLCATVAGTTWRTVMEPLELPVCSSCESKAVRALEMDAHKALSEAVGRRAAAAAAAALVRRRAKDLAATWNGRWSDTFGWLSYANDDQRDEVRDAMSAAYWALIDAAEAMEKVA